MYVKVDAAAIQGIDAQLVTVEVNTTDGAELLMIVGLPDNTVKESQERILSAFEAVGFMRPTSRVVVNLAPADIRKEGAAFDLPIAVAVLAATRQIATVKIAGTMILGEMALDGTLRPIKGVLPLAAAAAQAGYKRIILPASNSAEAAVVAGIEVLGVESLHDVTEWLSDRLELVASESNIIDEWEQALMGDDDDLYSDDFADVKGQSQVKRAFEIAAAGGHNIIMIGPPGSGKTMLSRRMPSIMPPLSIAEALETTKIYSVAGKLGVTSKLLLKRPFRAPHHITSQVAIIGGGVSPQPGEVSLANNGVLFLDERPEFGRSVLEVLRQPLEERRITISRARYSVEYPANFTLVASMNPCPCGYYNHPTKECSCTPFAVHRYMNRISGPLLDRIDLHVEVAPVSIAELSGGGDERGESSREIRARVIRAREMQRRRFADHPQVVSNGMMSGKMVRHYCQLSDNSLRMLTMAMDRMQLSARAYDKIIKVARTIADLESSQEIESAHIAEAIGFRSLDRASWGEVR